jgi:hypothetical protein
MDLAAWSLVVTRGEAFYGGLAGGLLLLGWTLWTLKTCCTRTRTRTGPPPPRTPGGTSTSSLVAQRETATFGLLYPEPNFRGHSQALCAASSLVLRQVGSNQSGDLEKRFQLEGSLMLFGGRALVRAEDTNEVIIWTPKEGSTESWVPDLAKLGADTERHFRQQASSLPSELTLVLTLLPPVRSAFSPSTCPLGQEGKGLDQTVG